MKALLLLLLCTTAQAQSLSVTTEPAPASLRKGESATITATLKNTLTAQPPTVFAATVTWDDEYGVAQSTEASTSVQIVRPVKAKAYRWLIPALFDFVAGSARVNGEAMTPLVNGSEVTVTLGTILAEGQSVVVAIGVRAK